MSGMPSWSPIGKSSSAFTGTFDGQGHSIQNLVVKTNKSYSGLFGNTSGATIKNFSVGGTISVAEGSMEHGAVGYASNTTISDVHSSLNITTAKANNDTRHIGGIAGTMAAASNISRCSYAGTLTDAGTNTVGGIVGYADGSNNIISHVLNSGKIQSKGAETNTGGILGYVNYAGFKINHCLNVGSVSGAEAYSGQIMGRQVKAMTTLPSALYYLDGNKLSAFGTETESTSAVGATAVSAEQLASGEICYNLNGDQEEIIWFQTLESDAYPVLLGDHLQVWKYDDLYSNDSPDGIFEIQNSKFKIQNEDEVYDLSGRKIDSSLFTLHSSLRKGIYVINGKKYMIK